MALHRQKEDVLLAWINSLRLANPVNNIILLQDGILLLKLICKLKGQEVQGLLDQPIQKRLEFVSDFLRTAHCRYKADRGAIISWDNILNRKDLDIELSKVVVLLMCHAIVNELLITDELDHKTEIQMAAVLRFVLDNENSLHLSDNLEKFLQKPFTVCLPSDSSTSSFSDESPVLSRIRRPEVKFLELMTVASSSAGSPIQEVLNTPQFQLRKVRKQLAEERDMRDELERELANTSQLVAERELQISQLQHRLQRLMRDNAEQDQEPKALEELQNKNEGLLKHLHEVLKQCQDLKTNKGQMEKKIDQLTEENGDLSVNIKDMVARLSSAQTMVDTLSEEQQASQAEWESKKMFFETELCQAVSEKESLSEQIQILRGKISILEDELRKAHAQTQERGEVMGPIMEWERLNQEISELTCKLLQLQETILQLEKEKGEMQAKHEMEKNKFESEVSHLQGLISELQHTLCVLRGEREALEQISREQQATMTSQISAMNAEIARLSDVIHQKELAATVFSQQVAEEQKQKEILMQNMEKQDQINQETVQGLSEQVKHLETTLKSKEEESSRQQAFLQEASESAIQERDTILVEYHQFRQAKEEEVLDLNKQVRQLEEQREVERSLLSDLRREKEELHLKLISLESAIRDLQNELEVESRKHRETLAAKLQKHSQMESEITELGHRVQQLLTDIKLMGQQLNEAQQEKRHAESCVEELKIECRELSNALSAERDHSLHLAKERAAEVEMLSANVQTKTEEVEKLAKETEQYLVELEATRTAKSTVESHLNSVIEKHQAEICTLHLELTDVQGLVKQKEAEKELLQDEISTKEEEVKIQQERVLYLQSETAQMEELRQNLAEEEKRHQMTKQDADARMAEVQLLRVSLDEKEDKISTLLQSIQALEEKACALQDVQNKESEDYKHSVSELEQRVAESQAQICKKVTAFETQSQLVLSLQKDLALEQARAVSLEENLKALESALRTQKVQEKELREESIVHREELNRQKADLEKLHQEILLIQEEKREAESREVIATEKITILQAEVLSVSSLATERNESLEHMKKKFAAVSIELNCLKEQDIERNKLAAADCKRQEEAIHKLHRDLLSASSLSSERDQEIQMLQTKVSSLKKELEIQEEMQCLRDQETNAMRSKCRELEEKITQLEAQVLEASTLASGKELELCTLRSEFTERENLRLNAAETEAAQRRELEEKVAQLQAQVQEASTLASGKESELCTLRSELKERETLRLKAAETEAAQRRELEEKVSQLEAQVLKASTLASGKESELCTLRSELKERENLRLNAAETEAAQRRELEEKVSQLEAQVLEASTLASGKELELCTLRSELKERENLRLNAAETEAAQRRELEEKVAQLLEASTLASGKELELCTLRSELKERENLRLNAAETEAAQRRELEEKVSQLEAQLLEASTLASGKELELCTLRSELKERENLRLNAAETEAAQRRELEEKVSQLEAQVLEASTLASGKELELCTLRSEFKERENLRLNAAETEAAQRRELEEKVSQLEAQVLEASTLASGKELELCTLRSEFTERENLRLNAAETEAAQRRELEEKVAQLQAQVQEASTLASGKESELCTLRSELKERENLRLNAAETEAAQRRELEENVAQLEAQVLGASTLASGKESELCTLRSGLKERENLRLNAAETEAAQRRELEEKVAQLEAQLLEASTLASGKESELCTLRSELKERENLRLNAAETEAAQRRELEEKVSQLEAQLLEASTNVSLRESELSSLHKGMEEIIANLKAKLLSASTQEENATKLQQQIAALRHTNEELLLIREGLQKEQEVSQKLTEDLATQLQLAREELSTLRPLRGEMAERSQLNTDLQEQLSLKSEALEHYKAQVENAKIHYNGKKQQLLEANEKIQALTTALETNEQEIKTLTEQIQVLQLELEQARATEKNFLFNINSLQAQLDYADKQLREQKRLGKCEELKPKETVYQKVTEKQQDTSGDSLDLSLEDSLNSTRRPSKREESSTPVLRSSERLQAKQRARGGESLETLYFTPMSVRNAVDGKLESSITSLGELVLDSAKRSHSARRRTTQVINITMTKKTPGRVEADPEDGFTSALSLQSAQSFPNLANQRCRPFSLEFSEEATASDQLRHLPGYRRSAAHSAAPPRSISTFRVGAENEPDHSEDWMRIAELQARNQACLPHLKSSYPIESRPSLGNPSFTITDDDLKMGDPNETIRRASMMPSQITDSLASHRLSMLPGQIHDAPLSRRETMLPGDIGSRAASQHAALHPKRCASNAQNTRAATLPLKRGGCDLPGPDTPETKKLASCFPRPMTPKDRNDRRFALQNSQNRPPNTPVERRQSMMFSIENTPKKNGKSFLQKGINKMRASTRKSPGSTSKIPRSAKSPRGEKPQRRSPRINSNKSPKITSSARKNVSAQFMECVFVQREDMALETEQQPR
ncbi:nuclear mitotic apparatus protein 1 isoform X3 [Anguilla anguilla]|uniref:nuclear mitotic apparatus protein 1 isoform X3 n=1 Tax=Anguilla anguilla TaxID=7936 RepID=UPI0015ACC6F2|nr:nuclear mitotic apparatus protein 1 isoform X3 [Anguilla anguilla]